MAAGKARRYKYFAKSAREAAQNALESQGLESKKVRIWGLDSMAGGVSLGLSDWVCKDRDGSLKNLVRFA